ncbi:MAG: AAA family ATPase [Candidatus Taylorbacteria bacterium]|nr:AAA family ATPase [Candidatus Taylorbacteria bacterium]
MKIFDLKTTATPFWPAVFIDRVFKMNVGRWLAIVVHFSAFLLSVPVLIIFILGKLAIVEGQAGVIAATLVNNLAPVTPFIYGLFFIALPLELIFQAATAFYRSYAYLDLESISTEKNTSQMGCSFEAASLILQSPEMDPVRAIAMTHVGQTAFYRLGIGLKETAAFLNDRKGLISLGDIDVDDKSGTVTFHKLAKAVVAADKEFNIFLSSRKVTTDDFVGAIGWAEHIFNLVRRHKRWWSKDALGRIPGIGKDWSYGETPTLWKYAMHIGETPYYLDAPNVLTVRKKEVEELEKVLERISGANAIIVGDEAMISAAKDKATFDVKLGNAFAEAIKAGNIILVIKDFPAFIAAAAELGSDVMSFLDMYLASPSIHLIATASTGSFHAAIEGKQAIMRHFEKLLLKSVGGNAVVDYLKNEALTIEGRTGVTFLYQALNEAAVSAERYFFGSDLEDKAADLLIEAATNAKSLNTKVVTREDIMKLVEVKTGIPREATSGSADTKTLLNLEKILSERIVGQQEGVKAIASAMRRARAGITNPKRPMGSFLFLGPTGVGKTETTKALADSFFGGESAIIRLDMSEYRTMDALERLIGNFDLGKPGVLTSALRDKPYGVLLLDEFEKTSKDVLDLFLQVLD